MAQFAFNVSLGREVEFYSRVLTSDPPYSAFQLLVLANAGIETDAVLRTYDTVAAILANNDEVTNAGYSRIILTAADLDAYTVDDAFHTTTLPLDNQTFPSIAVGDSWRKLVIAYDDDSTGGADSGLIPVCAHDTFIGGVAAVPNGSNIIMSFPRGILISS